MKPLVVLGTRLRPIVIERLSSKFELVVPADLLRADQVPSRARGARILLTLGTLPTDAQLMDALPSLGLIACHGSGYEGVDIGAAAARGIQVSHSPGGNASSVADHAMGLLLAIARRVVVSDRYVRDGRWRAHPSPDVPVVPGLTGRRLGIFGLGLVGMKVAARAESFEMEIGYHGRQARPGVTYGYHSTLASLAAWADILVVATRATTDNRMAVSSDVLEALGPEGYLINVARGSLVDQAALITALEAGTIAGAGLDVYEREPLHGSELVGLDDVVLTPHIAGATLSAQHAAIELVVSNVDSFLAGRPLPNPVAPDRLR